MKRILLSSITIASLLTAFACQPGGGGDVWDGMRGKPLELQLSLPLLTW